MTIENIKNELLPTYECVLPFSNQKIYFNPFKVKDIKNLAIILQEDNKKIAFKAMIDLLKSNTKDVSINDLCLADAEYIYIQMRGKSVGESISLKYGGESIKFNVSDIKFKNSVNESKLKINEKAFVIIKTPTVKDFLDLDFDDSMMVTKKYIKQIIINNEIYDLNKFLPTEIKDLIENLPYSFLKEMEKIKNLDPQLYISVNSKESEKEITGTLNFFTLPRDF